jgi:DtxR family Mn-dependent transcriptional regulator
MLHEMLGVEWYKVHDEAERLEHAISDDVEQKLIDRLGADRPCPHGNQINKSPAERRKSGFQLLWEASPGSVVRVESVDERDSKLLEYFDGLGIRPGAQVKVVSPNYDGTLALDLGDKPTNLAEAAAKKIWVLAITKHSESPTLSARVFEF